MIFQSTSKPIYVLFDRMIEERKRRGKDVKWSCGEEVYLWWMQDNNVVGQMELSDFIEY